MRPNRSCRSGSSAARCSPCAACSSFIVGFAMLGRPDVPAHLHAIRRRRVGDGIGPADIADGRRTAADLDGQRRRSQPHRPYKIFPVVGTAVMPWASCCCRGWTRRRRWCCSRSTCSSSAPESDCACRFWSSSCRTPSSFEDLGVATSGVTFFRTIGSSFGAAIFGSLFTNFLDDRIGRALAR